MPTTRHLVIIICNVINLILHSSLLGSGIVSTSLQCGANLCDTTGYKLANPVVITIEHYETIMV